MMARPTLLHTAALALACIAGNALADGTAPANAPVNAPVTAPADMQLVAKGAYLASAGDCVACHTAPQGKPFAGGLAMSTPIGAVYSTNITPDKTHGIGGWSTVDLVKGLPPRHLTPPLIVADHGYTNAIRVGVELLNG